MTTDTHCPRCDRVPAEGEMHGETRCFGAETTDPDGVPHFRTQIPAVDWRARALAAMAERDGAWNAAIEAAAKEVADTDVVTRTLGYSTFDDGIDTLRNARQAVEALRRPNATPAPAAREVEWRCEGCDANLACNDDGLCVKALDPATGEVPEHSDRCGLCDAAAPSRRVVDDEGCFHQCETCERSGDGQCRFEYGSADDCRCPDCVALAAQPAPEAPATKCGPDCRCVPWCVSCDNAKAQCVCGKAAPEARPVEWVPDPNPVWPTLNRGEQVARWQVPRQVMVEVEVGVWTNDNGGWHWQAFVGDEQVGLGPADSEDAAKAAALAAVTR
jgi:hypothetical protein